MKPGEREFAAVWAEVWGRLGTPPPPVGPLLTRYGEPHRHYHTAAHVVDCLAELDACPLPPAAGDRTPLQLALFYHDALYDPGATDNEAQSADLARAELSPALPADTLAAVVRLIHATDHRSPPVHADERAIVDIDLAILGQPPAVFDTYERAIRLEYAHVPDDAFRAGRSKILRHFLARPRLYHLPWFADRYAAPARSNLQRSLAALESPPAANE